MKVENIIKAEEDRREYRGLVLDNELKVLLVSDERAERSAAALDVAVGHMSDPPNLQGLAHLCEHMLFLGSNKYPDMFECSRFLSEHGGDSNADTSPDHTSYYFHITPNHFAEALDRFAQCLKDPLFTEDALEREINAVNEEHEKNVSRDSWRLDQLEKSTSDPEHPFSRFGTGNKLTLDVIPKTEGISVQEELRHFYDMWYSSNIMALCLLGRQSLDELQEMALAMFSDVKNKNVTAPSWTQHPFGRDQLQMRCYVSPLKAINTLDITFPTPDLDQYYRAAPGQYLSHLLEKDSPGSLVGALAEKGWGSGVEAEARTGYRGFGFFGIDIALTEEGVLHVDDIVKLVFQYINTIKEAGPQEWIFNELRDIMETQFHIKDEEIAPVFVANLAENLNLFPMKEVLCCDYLVSEWRPDLIEMILSHLVPENMRVAIISQKFENRTDQVEKWYGTKHKLEKIPEDMIKEINDAALSDEFRLPPPNEFVTNDFKLLTGDKSEFPHPKIVYESSLLTVWLKQDEEFLLPKAELIFEFVSSVAYNNAESCIMSTMLVGLLQESVGEYTHAAEVAGITWGVQHTKYGLELEVGGCSGKQHVLLEKILDKLVNLKVDTRNYHIHKNNCMHQLKRLESPQPVNHALTYMEVILEEKAWTNAELIAALSEVSLDHFQEFITQFLAHLHVECLVHGNADQNRALKIAQVVEDRLASCSTASCEVKRLRETQLVEGANYLLEVYDTVHRASGVAIYYQCEKNNNIPLALLVEIMREPCFKKLPFVVSCEARKSTGLRIVAQSEQDPRSLEHAIENFLLGMKTFFEEMTDQQWKKYKQSLLSQRTLKPRTLASQTARLWSEILHQERCFHRAEKELAQLRDLSKQDIIDYYERYVVCGSPSRRRLVVIVVSAAKGDAGDTASSVECLPLGYTEPTKIDDIAAFKASQGMFPYYNGASSCNCKVTTAAN
ncbi:insulin-degrading enzyme isoform X1 [Anabrus simplex]|uniref:insulin-degrading enzyme isoform X1 n=1 Tax=Anabrus simplex TaxID=316456 RepID=UPI0035A386EE